jgi:RNA polymerase subunit RPABC4/transcription elongation factor Spt4
MALISCPDCKKQISDQADACPQCGHPMSTSIKCPNCKSTNVKKIGGLSKAGSFAMWGVFSMGKLIKTYECKSCKFKW